jgi:hypothetical protein
VVGHVGARRRRSLLLRVRATRSRGDVVSHEAGGLLITTARSEEQHAKHCPMAEAKAARGAGEPIDP